VRPGQAAPCPNVSSGAHPWNPRFVAMVSTATMTTSIATVPLPPSKWSDRAAGVSAENLWHPSECSRRTGTEVAGRVEPTPSRDAAFGQDDHFRLPPRTQARRLCVTRQERSPCRPSTITLNSHRSRSPPPTATKNPCRSRANVDDAAASSEQGPVSCRERSVIGGRARRVAQTRSP